MSVMPGSASSQHGSVPLGATAHFFNPGIVTSGGLGDGGGGLGDGGGGLGDSEIVETIETPLGKERRPGVGVPR
eukprot:scaffold2466_cov71-Phaeocystis_antarctica.AAC.2